MADPAKLTAAFLRSHPIEAAQVLESANAVESAAIFNRVPARIAALVLSQMQPAIAARWLVTLTEERSAEILNKFDAQPAVALLRHLEEPARSRLIDSLSAASALATRLLLGYPDDSVGSQVDHGIVALLPDTTARDALERVRRNPGAPDRIFLVDNQQRFLGWVALVELLRAPDGAPVASLSRKPGAVLAANATLESAETHPGWHDQSILPVLEHGEKLIGALARDALERALHARTRPDGRRADANSVAGEIALGYWAGLSGILEALVSLLPVRPLATGKPDGR